MKLGIIDIEMLQKEIDQHETLASNSRDTKEREIYFAISHALQRIMSKTGSLEDVITKVWAAAQEATADREGYINVNMDDKSPKLNKVKNTIIYGKEQETDS